MNDPRDLQMIISPGLWPAWPFLPLKNYKLAERFGPPKFGFLLDDPNSKLKVYEGNIFNRQAVAEAPVIAEFTTAEELLDAGWEVD